jgi:Aspartyl protease
LIPQQFPGPVTLPFSYWANYATAKARRPHIGVEIAATSPAGVALGEPVRTALLVDSGADTTTIDEAYAVFLGINLDQLRTDTAHGVGGGEVTIRYGTLRMDIFGRSLLVPVLFCRNQEPGLLGRAGVFDNFFLAFAHRQNTLLAQGV